MAINRASIEDTLLYADGILHSPLRGGDVELLAERLGNTIGHVHLLARAVLMLDDEVAALRARLDG